MATPTYDVLIKELQEQEARLSRTELQQRTSRHELRNAEILAAKRYLHLRALEALSVGTVGMIKEQAIYDLLCQTAVHQLKWDSAVVIEMHGKAEIKTSFHLTQKQLKALTDSLEHFPKFLKGYARHETFSTFGRDEAVALALRTVLHTDEVAGTPIMFGEQIFGYLLVCAHTERNRRRDQEDITFLKTLSSLAAHAVENCRSMVDLETQNEKLRKLDELKDSFISITSHQLRTPLSIVKWILSILDGDQELKKLPEQHKMIEQAYISNERLIHVVNDLLNVSRIQEGKLPYSPQPTDIRVILRELVSGMQKLCENKGIAMIAHVDTLDIPMLQVDPILFKEALQNILDNGLDYNKEGGTIRMELERGKKTVQVQIINTGPGIPKHELATIFDQFYRSKEAVKMHPNGNGLGLYLTKAIVHQHGGDVTVKSELGKETTFTITLPIHEETTHPHS